MKRLLMRATTSLMLGVLVARGYTPINSGRLGIDLKEVRIPGLRKKEISELMANYAASLGNRPKQADLQSKLIALSLLLDSTNRTALLANAKLKKGLKVSSDKAETKAQVVSKLMSLAQAVAKQKSQDSQRLAASLYSVASGIDPTNENALLKEELLSQKEIKPAWPKEGEPAKGGGNNPFPKGLAQGFADKRKTFVRNQASIAGMMVVDAGATGYIGKPLDVILNVRTIRKNNRGDNPQPEFKRKVGKEMQTSLNEAVRAVRLRYPRWQQNVEVSVSFSDKYSPKDGGSAGTAYAILMLSCLDGIDLDPKFAVTGDITVDWTVRKIGGAAEKIRGARVAGYKYAFIPEENAKDVADIPLLYSVSDLWRIQIFSASTLGEAIDLVRTERSPDLTKAMSEFKRVQEYLGKRGMQGLPQTKKVLRKILTLAPNHLSAKYLLQVAEGKAPRHLSLGISLSNVMLAVHPLHPHILGQKDSVNYILTQLPDEELEASKKRLAMLNRLVHPQAKELTEALIAYRGSIERIRKSVRELSRSKRSSGTMRKFVHDQAVKADENRNQVIEVLKKINNNREILEALRN